MLLAYEVLHTFRQKRFGSKGFMALKLDMSKTYDRAKWSFLREMMEHMVFAKSWLELIMRCITSIFYSNTINGKVGEIFSPSRGLRKGDL